MLSVNLQKWCCNVDDPGDSTGDKDQGGSEDIPASFQSQFGEITAFPAIIGESALSTLEDVFSFALEHIKTVAGALKQFQDGKYAAQERILLVEKETTNLINRYHLFRT